MSSASTAGLLAARVAAGLGAAVTPHGAGVRVTLREAVKPLTTEQRVALAAEAAGLRRRHR